MEKLTLENYGVQEMNAKELINTEGGNPIVLLFAGGLLGIAAYACYEIGKRDAKNKI